jgi:hypothetical protein
MSTAVISHRDIDTSLDEKIHEIDLIKTEKGFKIPDKNDNFLENTKKKVIGFLHDIIKQKYSTSSDGKINGNFQFFPWSSAIKFDRLSIPDYNLICGYLTAFKHELIVNYISAELCLIWIDEYFERIGVNIGFISTDQCYYYISND